MLKSLGNFVVSYSGLSTMTIWISGDRHLSSCRGMSCHGGINCSARYKCTLNDGTIDSSDTACLQLSNIRPSKMAPRSLTPSRAESIMLHLRSAARSLAPANSIRAAALLALAGHRKQAGKRSGCRLSGDLILAQDAGLGRQLCLCGVQRCSQVPGRRSGDFRPGTLGAV